MNQKIINSKIIVLTGAGASQPLGKYLMSEFIQFIKKTDNASPYFPIIISDLTDFIGTDLEEILTLLNSIEATAKHLSKTHWSLPYCPRLEGAKISGSRGSLLNSANDEIKNYFEYYKGIKDIVIKKIVEHYGVVDKKKVLEIYKSFINAIFTIQKTKVLPVFTTNYDSSIELLSGEENLKVFFASETCPTKICINPELYEKYDPDPQSNNIVLFHLHGAVNWIEEKNTKEIQYQSIIVPQNNSEYYVHKIVFPIKDKTYDDPIYDMPYNYFSRCLDVAKYIIVIGYSFRDKYLQSKIYSALDFNSELKIIVWDPCSKDLIAKYFPTYIDKFLIIEEPFPKGLDKLKSFLEGLTV